MIAKPSLRVIMFVVVTGIFFVTSYGFDRANAQTPDATANATQTPIKTKDELQAYLAAHRGVSTPFDAFVPASKAEFIAGLFFGRGGLAGFNIDLFQDQLTDAQRIALLSLFGEQDEIADYRPEHELSPSDRQKVRHIAELTSAPPSPADPIARSYQAIEHLSPSTEVSERVLQAKVRRVYDVRFAGLQRPSMLHKMGDADAIDVYRATYDAAFYTHDAALSCALLRDYLELERRNLTTTRNDGEVFDQLLASRLLPEAKAFAANHHDISTVVPDFRDLTAAGRAVRSELVVSDDAKVVTRRAFDFSKPAQVIVVSQPFCHFCQNAVRDIAAHPALERRMRRYSRWLETQDVPIDVSSIRNWNAAHPAERMTVVYQKTEWPMIDSWATPTFYFFKKKTLVAKMSGWPDPSRAADLERALHDIGAD